MSDDVPLEQVRLLGLPLQGRALFLRHLEGLLRELALVQIGAEQGPTSLPRRLLMVAEELDTTYARFSAGPAALLDAAHAAGDDFCDVTYTVPARAGGYVRRLLDVLEEADDFCRSERHLLTLPAPEEVVAYRRWFFGEFLRQLAGGEPRPWHGPVLRADADEDSDGDAGPEDAGSAVEPAPAVGGAQPVGDVVASPLVLDPMANTVAAARRYVRRVLHELDAAPLEESAELGVSELVTNAMLHARTAFAVTVRRMPTGTVRIEVRDSSPAPVQPRHFGVSATTGRGLRLLESVSAAWGITPLPDGTPGKVVWFEPQETMAGDAFAAEDWAAEIEGLA
ncbi:hypothetical protein CLV92_102277 [Kineococcus xinjiangensis]|uniref:Histidine kinase/HSP90-like ATPase domain-containing protein n=1 Tax=Kineococcus xinjiangensis TaxID=512762 RepID=A0A2S6IVN1_9ACTN|nr:ATP-binding protein [Kineococcus xinjiangensis]PPK98124.1 hypothetical protein CLV92_102277 [Kineococcus xinjiangensis]